MIKYVSLLALSGLAACAAGTHHYGQERIVKSWTERSAQRPSGLQVELSANADEDGVVRGRALVVYECTEVERQRIEFDEPGAFYTTNTRTETREVSTKTRECDRRTAADVRLTLRAEFAPATAMVKTDAAGEFVYDLASWPGMRFPGDDDRSHTLQISNGDLQFETPPLGRWLGAPLRESLCTGVEDCAVKVAALRGKGEAYGDVAAAIEELLFVAAQASQQPCGQALKPLRAGAADHAAIAADAEAMCKLSQVQKDGTFREFNALWGKLARGTSKTVTAYASKVSRDFLDRSSAAHADCDRHAANFPDDRSSAWLEQRCLGLKYGIPVELLLCCSAELPIARVLELQGAGRSDAELATHIDATFFRELTADETAQLQRAGMHAELIAAVQRSADAHAERAKAEAAQREAQAAEQREAERARERELQLQLMQRDCAAGCEGRFQACVEMGIAQGAVLMAPAPVDDCMRAKHACFQGCGLR
jgi:hypothetical protein